MNTDIELVLPVSPMALPVRRLQDEGFWLVEVDKGETRISRNEDYSGMSVDDTVSAFLRSLCSISDVLEPHMTTLRIGVYYDIEETVVFPFFLSSSSIRKIASLSLSLEATGYPCAT
ncbi:MAG TPA: hypothetical protein VF275_11280 [Gammaproteobacteria bacterium]